MRAIVRPLRFALKEVEPENILVDGHDWRKVGEGEQTVFRLHVKLDSPELMRVEVEC